MQTVVGHERHETGGEQCRLELAHPGSGHGLASFTVGHKLECPEDSRTADVADDLVLGVEFAKSRAKNSCADVASVLDDAFVFHRTNGGDDTRRR